MARSPLDFALRQYSSAVELVSLAYARVRMPGCNPRP